MGAGGHEFVEEGSGAVEEEGEGPEVEVGIALQRVLVAVVAVLGEVGQVEVAFAGRRHLGEERAVEFVVVAAAEEVVVTGQRGVGFEFVVPVETWLGASEGRVERGARRGVAADGELFGDDVAVGEGQAEQGQEVGEVVADVVDVLLGVNELIVGGDAVAGEEAVVGGGVETGARSADVVGAWRDEAVGVIAGSGDLVTALAFAGQAVLSSVVGVLGVVWHGGLMVCVEWASRSTTWLVAARLLPLGSCCFVCA